MRATDYGIGCRARSYPSDLTDCRLQVIAPRRSRLIRIHHLSNAPLIANQ